MMNHDHRHYWQRIFTGSFMLMKGVLGFALIPSATPSAANSLKA